MKSKRIFVTALVLTVALFNSFGQCPGKKPKPNWKDSYSANGFCWCDSQFDHGLNTKKIYINGTGYAPKDVCDELKKHPDYRKFKNGDIPYNDIQCGHGPANNAADETCCPGRVDQGNSGCQKKGPTFDMEWLSSRERFGGGNNGDVSITIGNIKTDCNASGKARNVIFFSVSGSSAKPSSNRGSVIADGANWKIKEVGVPYNTTINYIVSIGGESETVSVTSVNSNCQPGNVPTTYTISASVTGDGTISPSGNSNVEEGNNITYTITADPCASISSVFVDGVDQGAISVYTFTNVTTDHSIEANFTECSSLVDISITNITTDCNNGGKARNVIYFNVSGTSATPVISKGTLLNDGGGNYRLRDVGVAFGSATNYTISVEGESVTESVTSVSSCAKATQEISTSLNAQIYPNPSNGLINVALNNTENATFSIINLAGMIVYSTKIENELTTVDATELNKGIYIIQLSTSINTVQKRIVIQ